MSKKLNCVIYIYFFFQNSTHYLNDSVSVSCLFTFESVHVVLITWCVGREKRGGEVRDSPWLLELPKRKGSKDNYDHKLIDIKIGLLSLFLLFHIYCKQGSQDWESWYLRLCDLGGRSDGWVRLGLVRCQVFSGPRRVEERRHHVTCSAGMIITGAGRRVCDGKQSASRSVAVRTLHRRCAAGPAPTMTHRTPLCGFWVHSTTKGLSIFWM